MSKKVEDTGGSLERAIAGEYSFKVMRVIKTAWEYVSGFKGTFWLAFLIYGVIVVGLLFIILHLLGEGFWALVIFILIVAPIEADIMMLGIYRVGGRDVKASDIFGYYNKILKIIGTLLLELLLITIGFVFLVIPGIYLLVAYVFALPLILEKDLGIWEALETSRKAVSKRWFSFFGVFLVMGLIFILAIIPFGIGLIWVAPLMILVVGVLYREVFGILPKK